MKNMTHKLKRYHRWQIIALYLCCLVIMLPVVSSMAFAETRIETITVSGNDEIPNFRKASDVTKAKVVISSGLGGAGLRATDVEIMQTGTDVREKFDRCRFAQGKYECIYQNEEFEVDDESISYCVNARENGIFPRTCEEAPAQHPGTRKDLVVRVDASGPTFTQHILSKTAIKESEQVTLQFSGYDSLFGEDNEVCAGTKQVDIHKNGLLFKTITAQELQEQNCRFSHTTALQSADIDTGMNRFCLFASDKFNNIEDEDTCVELSKSDLPPQVEGFQLLNPAGQPISFVRQGGFSVKISFVAVTAFHPLKRAVLDLRTIGGQQNLELRGPQCVEQLGEVDPANRDYAQRRFECTADVQLQAGQSLQPTVAMILEDVAGNTGSFQQQLALQLDVNAPRLVGIETPYRFGSSGDYYLANGEQTLTAVIEETGAGLAGFDSEHPENVQNSIQFVVNGQAHPGAVTCTVANGNEYRCSTPFQVAVPEGQEQDFRISIQGSDLAGTPVNGEIFTLLVDAERPVVVAVLLIPQTDVDAQQPQQALVTGQPVIVSALIEEKFAMPGQPAVVGSEFGTLEPQACAIVIEPDQSGSLNTIRIWRCDWIVDSVYSLQAGQFAKANFAELKDLAENLAQVGGALHQAGVQDIDGVDKFLFVPPDQEIQIISETVDAILAQVPEAVPILGTTTDVPTNWRVVGGDQPLKSIPELIDAKTVEVSSYSVLYPFTLTTDDPVQLAGIRFIGCGGEDFENYVDSERTRLIGLRALAAARVYSGNLKVVFEKGPFDQAVKKFSAECQVQVLSRGATSATRHLVSSKSQALKFNITSSVGNVPEISDATWEKIRDLTDSLDTFSFLDTLSNIVKWFTTVCDIVNMLVGFTSVLTAPFMTAAEILEVTGVGVAAAKGIKGIVQSINDYTDSFQTIVGDFGCNWVTCRPIKRNEESVNRGPSMQWYNIVGDWIGGINEDLQRNGYPSHVWNEDPRQSLILSMATLCVPGIIENVQKWREIQCTYVDCLYERGKEGYPTFYCDKTRSFATCKAVFGELFAVIPFANLVKKLSKQLTELLSNPLTLIFFGLRLACNRFALFNTATFLSCKIPQLIMDFSAISEQWDQLTAKDAEGNNILFSRLTTFDQSICPEIIEKVKNDPMFDKQSPEAEGAPGSAVTPRNEQDETVPGNGQPASNPPPPPSDNGLSERRDQALTGSAAEAPEQEPETRSGDMTASSAGGFSTKLIHVRPGTRIIGTITKTDNAIHTFTIDGLVDINLDTPNPVPFEFTANQEGTFRYYCKNHAGMEGQLVVEAFT